MSYLQFFADISIFQCYFNDLFIKNRGITKEVNFLLTKLRKCLLLSRKKLKKLS